MQTEQIQENTASIQEPIVKGGGESFVSFDELENAMQTHKMKSTPEAEARPEKKVEAKAEKDQTENKKDAKDHGKEKSQKSEEIAEEIRLLKLKNGDSDVELRPDALLDVVVDGKKQKASVQDLINNYSGKVAYDKKFNQLSQERKAFEMSRQQEKKQFERIQKVINSKDPRAIIHELAEIAGADPFEALKGLEEGIQKAVESYSSMSAEEIELNRLKQENEWRRNKDAELRKNKEQEALVETYKKQIADVQAKYGIDDGTFVKSYDELRKLGEIPETEITPDMIGEYYEQVSSREKIKGMLQDCDPDLIPDPDKAVEEIRALQVSMGLSWEEVQDAVNEAFGTKSSKNLVKKLKKSAPANTARASTERKREPVLFSDLD